ncbi:DUF4145 domain-containing protein [Synechococcus elongatus IITB4]|uniref:DUF4145 domain-containing protein n=1 Tax=Synechococcus elongatus TaxID=32046 RepID=UPI0030D5AC59
MNNHSLTETFIIDCPHCKAKVAAIKTGCAEKSWYDDDLGEPFAHKVLVGHCPRCQSILVGETLQTDFALYNSDEDRWSEVTRIYPQPSKIFSSFRIPSVVKSSLSEADRSLQAGSNIAACVMLGRAIEAVCRDILESMPQETASTDKTQKKYGRVMLGEGINMLHKHKIIDDRLHEWSQQLHAFRNLSAHPEDISISREDVEDLQTFAHAIIEYIYDLADRYLEFTARADARVKRKKL